MALDSALVDWTLPFFPALPDANLAELIRVLIEGVRMGGRGMVAVARAVPAVSIQ